jgi:hypothetical protein
VEVQVVMQMRIFYAVILLLLVLLVLLRAVNTTTITSVLPLIKIYFVSCDVNPHTSHNVYTLLTATASVGRAQNTSHHYLLTA